MTVSSPGGDMPAR
jgi:hypothetical protein